MLIPKEGKDLPKPESYRPVSLLNVDYTHLCQYIGSKVEYFCRGMYRRSDKVLKTKVHEKQYKEEDEFY